MTVLGCPRSVGTCCSASPIHMDLFYGKPEIALLERFERKIDSSREVSVDAFVYFADDLGRLDTIEALEQQR